MIVGDTQVKFLQYELISNRLVAVFDNGHLKDDLENGQIMIDALLHKMGADNVTIPAPLQDPLIDVHNSVWDRIVKVCRCTLFSAKGMLI